MFNFLFHFGVIFISFFTWAQPKKFRLDERIPNLVSKWKSDIIWPSFWQKNCRKRSITGKVAKFARFRPLCGQKEGEMLFDFNFETIFGVLLSRETFWPKNEGKLKKIGHPIVFPKLQSLKTSPVFKTPPWFSVWVYLKPKGIGKHHGNGNLTTFFEQVYCLLTPSTYKDAATLISGMMESEILNFSQSISLGANGHMQCLCRHAVSSETHLQGAPELPEHSFMPSKKKTETFFFCFYLPTLWLRQRYSGAFGLAYQQPGWPKHSEKCRPTPCFCFRSSPATSVGGFSSSGCCCRMLHMLLIGFKSELFPGQIPCS